MKKIYFACAITSGREHAETYAEIVALLKRAGLHVLSELFADKNISASEGTHSLFPTPKHVWENDMAWLQDADAVIAEVSKPSLGVGYEIGAAYQLGIPVLALYQPHPDRRLSSMIVGSPNVTVFEYKLVKDIKPALDEFLDSLA